MKWLTVIYKSTHTHSHMHTRTGQWCTWHRARQSAYRVSSIQLYNISVVKHCQILVRFLPSMERATFLCTNTCLFAVETDLLEAQRRRVCWFGGQAVPFLEIKDTFIELSIKFHYIDNFTAQQENLRAVCEKPGFLCFTLSAEWKVRMIGMGLRATYLT